MEQRELTQATAGLRAGDWSALSIDYVLLHLLRLLRGKHHADSSAPQMPGWLASALGQVSVNRQHFQSTRALARLAGRSPEHLSRELRRWTGKTPTDVINEARMTYAARALIESGDKIMTIALDCGIQNLGYFYRLFQRTFGTSPQAYRIHHRSIVDR
jgi:AraC family cel operon transcriptional repressor